MTISKFPAIILAALLSLAAVSANAQKAAVKTNLLNWATGTVNFGAELAVGPKTTIDVVAACNIPGLIYFGDKARNRKLWNWTLQPEVRFWHTEAFSRSFVGIHAGGGAFDAGGITLPLEIFPGLGKHRYEGWMIGAGFSYGRQWRIASQWNLEATFGFGYRYVKYNRFASPASSVIDEPNETRHYFGPTRIGLSVSYMLRSKK